MKKILIHILSLLLIGAIIYFLGREFVKNWEQIRAYNFDFNVPLIIAASLGYAGALWVLSIGWHFILVYLHAPLPLHRSILYFFITQPAKYIPGKIWIAVARMKFCKRHEIPNSITLLSAGIEGVLEIFAGAYVSIIALLKSTTLFTHMPAWIFFVVTAAGILVLIPDIFYGLINLYLRIARQRQIPKQKYVSFGKLLVLQIIYIAGLLLIGLAQFLFLQSFAPVDIQYFPLLLSIGSFSYAVSIAALFTPSGLGVREGIWYVALKKITPKHIGLIYAFVSRLWMIVIEALLVFMSLPLLRFMNKERKGDGVER